MDPRSGHIRPLPGSITIEAEGDLRVLCARGELDSAVVQEFRDRQGREPLVVDAIDAGAVTFISSTGIAIILRCLEASKAAGRAAVLRASSPRVDRVLQLSGMEGAFRRESADQARADPH
ncbi:MAG: STAS domain-containing protein [Frankiaceae bacterium]